MEKTIWPIIDLMLPLLQQIRIYLHMLICRVRRGTDFESPQLLTRRFTQQTLDELNNMRGHKLGGATCVLHPCFQKLHFFDPESENAVAALNVSALAMLCCTMNNYGCDKEHSPD